MFFVYFVYCEEERYYDLKKLTQQDNFTETEKIIANSIVGMTSSKLEEITYTSQAAVVRLYKKLEIDKFRPFYAFILDEAA